MTSYACKETVNAMLMVHIPKITSHAELLAPEELKYLGMTPVIPVCLLTMNRITSKSEDND